MRWAQRTSPSFLCLPKEKKAKERAPHGLVCAALRLPCAPRQKTGAAELPRCARSDSPRADPFSTCGARLHQGGKRDFVAGYWHPGPVDAAEHRSDFRRQARACLSGRRPRVHARRKSREAQGTPCDSKGQVVGGPFLWFVSFGQAKEMNVGALHRAQSNLGCAPPRAFKSYPFGSANKKPHERRHKEPAAVPMRKSPYVTNHQ